MQIFIWPSSDSLPPSRKRGGLFDLDTVASHLHVLASTMSQADFWSDQARARKISEEAAELEKEYGAWQKLKEDVEEVKELLALAHQERDEQALEELAAEVAHLEARYKKLEFAMLLSGEYDRANVLLALHAGSGGTEAQDWTAMLLRMYLRFCERRGWKTELISESRGAETGLKSVLVRVTGRLAYGFLKSEAGTHRLVRVSPFDAEKMRHTSFALVEVLPELDDIADIEIDPKDLRIDTFMSGGKGGQSVNTTYSAVRIVHIPTGVTVNCQNERSQAQNKEMAMKILAARLLKLKEEEREKEKRELRGEYKSAEWGSQIRSYVLHPYKLVKDHRTEHETSEAEKVLDGDLDGFIEAYLQGQVESSVLRAEANKDE